MPEHKTSQYVQFLIPHVFHKKKNGGGGVIEIQIKLFSSWFTDAGRHAGIVFGLRWYSEEAFSEYNYALCPCLAIRNSTGNKHFSHFSTSNASCRNFKFWFCLLLSRAATSLQKENFGQKNVLLRKANTTNCSVKPLLTTAVYSCGNAWS